MEYNVCDSPKRKISKQMLVDIMNNAVKEEDYETAAAMRDIINKHKDRHPITGEILDTE